MPRVPVSPPRWFPMPQIARSKILSTKAVEHLIGTFDGGATLTMRVPKHQCQGIRRPMAASNASNRTRLLHGGR